MKKKRYLPFGYQIQKGVIVPETSEASAVQSIFECYLEGASLQAIARQMQQKGVKYREDAVWNKQVVSRILDCDKYASREDWPRILPENLFHEVQCLRKEKTQLYGGTLNPALQGIRELLCCHTCGQKLTRINRWNHTHIIWACPSCRTETGYLSDKELLQNIALRLNTAIQNPQKVRIEQNHSSQIPLQAIRLENKIRYELSNPQTDSHLLLEMIQQCAQEKYKGCCCDQHLEETERLIDQLSNLQPSDSFQPQVLKNFIHKVLITPAGTVTIELTNGAIF